MTFRYAAEIESNLDGKNLNWLFAMRGIADYGGVAHVSAQEGETAIASADEFVQAIRSIIRDADGS